MLLTRRADSTPPYDIDCGLRSTYVRACESAFRPANINDRRRRRHEYINTRTETESSWYRTTASISEAFLRMRHRGAPCDCRLAGRTFPPGRTFPAAWSTCYRHVHERFLLQTCDPPATRTYTAVYNIVDPQRASVM